MVQKLLWYGREHMSPVREHRHYHVLLSLGGRGLTRSRDLQDAPDKGEKRSEHFHAKCIRHANAALCLCGFQEYRCANVVFYRLDAAGTYFLRGIFQLLLLENYSTVALKGAK